MERSLREKAIKIKGKSYVLVSDRVVYFNEHFPNGSIQTELISEPTSKYIIVRAIVVPDITKPDRFYTGYSQAVVGQGFINEVSALENAETSAVGRALAFMGIGVIDSIASANELGKAEASRPAPSDSQSAARPDLSTYRTVSRPFGATAGRQQVGDDKSKRQAQENPRDHEMLDNDTHFS